MRHIILLIVCAFFELLPINAQEIYIQTKKKSSLFKLERLESEDYLINGSYEGTIRDCDRVVVNLETREQYRLNEPVKLKVLGLQNSEYQFYYDTYVVLYNNEPYYLHRKDVKSNTYLDYRNQELDTLLPKLQAQLDSLKISYDENYKNSLSLCRQKINNYEILQREFEQKLPSILDSITLSIDSIFTKKEKEMEKYLEIGYNNKMDLWKTKYLKWYDSLPISTQKALKVISITDMYLSEPNSVGGCDFHLHCTNVSPKTIKYMRWTGNAYNAVDDMVASEIGNKYVLKGYTTGPFKIGEDCGGVWDCIIYNNTAKRIELSSISIQYMDNSEILISEKDIEKMLEGIEFLESKPQNPIEDFEYRYKKAGRDQNKEDLIFKEYSDYVKRLGYEKQLSDWKYCLFNLKHKFTPTEYVDFLDNDLNTLYRTLSQLQNQIQNITDKIENFDSNNFLL